MHKFFACLAVCAYVLVFAAPHALAQVDTSGGLQLTPTSARLMMLPGEVKTVTFSVKNTTNAATYVSSTLLDFVPDIQGYPKFLPESSSPDSSLKHIATIPDSQPLAPGEQKTFDVTIAPAIDQPEGVYYGSVIFSASQEKASSTTSISGLAGSMVVEIGSKLKYSARIVSLEVGRKQKTDELRTSRIFSSPFNVAYLTVENTGTAAIYPKGKLRILGPDAKLIDTVEISPQESGQVVLPNSSRRFAVPLSKSITTPGNYKVDVAFGFDDTGQYLYDEIQVWYVPPWVPLAVVVAITLAVIMFARHHSKKAHHTDDIEPESE